MTCEFEDAPKQGQMAGILPGRGSPAIEPRTNHRRRLARPLMRQFLGIFFDGALDFPEAHHRARRRLAAGGVRVERVSEIACG